MYKKSLAGKILRVKAQIRPSSRKLELDKMPPDWREGLSVRLGVHRATFLALAVSGGRLSDLETPVFAEIDGGDLVLMIVGKAIGGRRHWRELRWSLPREGLVNEFEQQIRDAGGWMSINLTGHAKRTFVKVLEDAAAAEWPDLKLGKIAFLLRLQFYEDCKKAHLQQKTIEAAMGLETERNVFADGDKAAPEFFGVVPNAVSIGGEIRRRYMANIPK